MQKTKILSKHSADQALLENENDLVAVPFDKGIGICVMKRQDYHQKLD